jgi:hypothetical protein
LPSKAIKKPFGACQYSLTAQKAFGVSFLKKINKKLTKINNILTKTDYLYGKFY